MLVRRGSSDGGPPPVGLKTHGGVKNATGLSTIAINSGQTVKP